MSLVHLTLAANETEADIISSLLQSEHIACTHRQNLSPMAYGGTGGIEILVTDTDLPLALELIADQEDDAA
jgi:Putative prokaryotic signal transducing protein